MNETKEEEEKKNDDASVTNWAPRLRLDPPLPSLYFMNLHLNTCDTDQDGQKAHYTMLLKYDN